MSIKFLEKCGIDSLPIVRPGDSYVDRAKNALLAMFLKTDCTHILMIDSDMSWDMPGLKRIIEAPVDFVGGVYPMKNEWGKFCGNILKDAEGYPANHDVTTGLLEAEWVPGGFLMVSRNAVEAMVDYYRQLFYRDGDLNCHALFESYAENGVWQSEDVLFCKRWRAMGKQVWCEPRIRFSHAGVKEWFGNYHDYLLNLPGGLNNIGGTA